MKLSPYKNQQLLVYYMLSKYLGTKYFVSSPAKSHELLFYLFICIDIYCLSP